MTADTMLRPAVAARRYGVSERTLARWSAAGLIGRSEIGRIVLYDGADIADLIARHTQPRTVVPIDAEQAFAPSNWADDDFWKEA